MCVCARVCERKEEKERRERRERSKRERDHMLQPSSSEVFVHCLIFVVPAYRVYVNNVSVRVCKCARCVL